MFVVEVRESGTSITPGAKRIVARGDLVVVAQLFPVLVTSGEYEHVGVYDEDSWECLAEWSLRGIPERV